MLWDVVKNTASCNFFIKKCYLCEKLKSHDFFLERNAVQN